MDRFLFLVILAVNIIPPNLSTNNIAYNIPDPECTGVFNLCTDVDKERLGRQAIKTIHEQMDDDKDGLIEESESRDFIKEELESKSDAVRHSRFQNADLQITYNDLWAQWKNSAVYNWTNDEVVQWLTNYVQTPIYAENFRRNQVDGRMIPRIAANEKHYLSNIMQVRDPRHKRRLTIKATDIVLFGPPKHTHNRVKDVILMCALLISIGACSYAYIRHRRSQESMKKMLRDLETLQQAGGDLMSVTGKMKAMENELKEKVKVDRGLLNSWFIEVQRTKEEAEKFRRRRDSTPDQEKQLRLAVSEIEQLRIALRKAEEHARHQSFEAPSELVDLLKRTYHIEEAGFELKRKSAENAMLAAKEQMTKISKMQRGFFGAVRIAHTDCMDNIGELINAAKDRLVEVHDEYEEREKRWNRIGSLLDREDLVSNSSSSTASTNVNQYLSANTHLVTNNGTTNNTSADSHSRPKQLSIDSTSLHTANIDSPMISKKNINNNARGVSINPLLPLAISQHDPTNPAEHSLEPYIATSTLLKRRTIGDSHAVSNHLSTDGLMNSATMVYSNSTNGLNNSHLPPTAITRNNTYDSFDILSASKSSRPTFDMISDLPCDNRDSMSSDQQDGISQLLSSTHDDRSSLPSSDKTRKSMLSTRILKPFQNMRLRKKNSTA